MQRPQFALLMNKTRDGEILVVSSLTGSSVMRWMFGKLCAASPTAASKCMCFRWVVRI